VNFHWKLKCNLDKVHQIAFESTILPKKIWGSKLSKIVTKFYCLDIHTHFFIAVVTQYNTSENRYDIFWSHCTTCTEWNDPLIKSFQNIIENFVHIFGFFILLETYFLMHIFIDRARSARFLSRVNFSIKFSTNFTGIFIPPQFSLLLV